MLQRVLGCVGVLTLVVLARPIEACPFCQEERGPTLVGDFGVASLVLLGNFTNPVLGGSGFQEGTTDFVIEEAIKSNDALKNLLHKDKKEKVVTLPKYLPQAKNKFIVFCEVYKGNLDPYRGIELAPQSEMVKYLKGAVALKEKTQGDRLRYCFDFLNSAEFEIAIDAYREFAKADYKDYQEMARKLPPDTIAGWLKDPKTPAYRYGLYASLLGHCGKDEHAQLLRSMIDDPEKRKGSGIDGLLAAYVMLKPSEAWSYVQDLLRDGKQDFLLRYASLRTVRFLWDQRPDLITQKQLVQGLGLLLPQNDMADFAIEDLRKYKRWELADQVLDLFTQKSHNIPVIKRSILRYALQCDAPRAKTFVQAQRQRDADWVRDIEELLKLENPSSSTGATPKSK